MGRDEFKAIWFTLIKEFKDDMHRHGIPEEAGKDIIQTVKSTALRELNLHGTMLSLKEKHVVAVREIYRSVLRDFYVTSE